MRLLLVIIELFDDFWWWRDFGFPVNDVAIMSQCKLVIIQISRKFSLINSCLSMHNVVDFKQLPAVTSIAENLSCRLGTVSQFLKLSFIYKLFCPCGGKISCSVVSSHCRLKSLICSFNAIEFLCRCCSLLSRKIFTTIIMHRNHFSFRPLSIYQLRKYTQKVFPPRIKNEKNAETIERCARPTESKVRQRLAYRENC